MSRLITSEHIRSGLPLKTWWATLMVLPLSVRLICFVVNRTSWTPNMITVAGLLLRITTAVLFILATPLAFVCGALAYVAAYVCDCTDGAVARLTGKTSEFGRYLDHVSDLLGDVLILLALAYSQNILSQQFVLAMAILHAVECYVSYLAGFALKQHEGNLGDFILLRWFNAYRQWWFKRNMKSFFSFPDYTAVVFVLFPVLGMPTLGLHVGFYMLLVVVTYTIFSTFAALHSAVKLFP